MRHPMTLAVTVLMAAPAVAQTAGTVQDITIVGTSELLANFLRATLTVQQGAPLSSVNVRQVEQEVIASGYFKTAVAELRTVGGRDTLVVTVTPNPTISRVDATGLTFLPAEGFKKSIGELLNVAPGATLNTQRIEQAKEALAQNYQSEGYPFQPSISSEVKTNADGSVTVNFVVDEAAKISRVEVSGVTLLPQSTVTGIFKPLYDAKRFTPETFFQAVEGLQQAYTAAGILQAGVDSRNTTLENGVLKVAVIEGKVADLDLSDLGNPQVTLQTQLGQPLNLERLRADVRALSNQTGKPVGFAIQPNPQDPSQVTVMFGAADIATGPVRSISVRGNTLVPSATLLAAVKTKVGDTYSPQLAQDDFLALRDAYRKAGYEISTRDAITFQEGALTFNVREVKLVGYELQWQGKHSTRDRVILRELPAPGTAYNQKTIQEALGRISRLGFVRPVGATVKSDPQNPENVTYVLTLTETANGIPVNLALSYDSLAGGLGGEAGYSNPNVFGLGHNFSLNAGVQQNEARQNFVGNASYTIPWLDLDFLDFRRTPTSLSFNVGSNVAGNNPVVQPGNTTDADKTNDRGTDTGYDYTVRTTGFSVNAGRNLSQYLRANVGVGVSQRTYFLEPVQKADKPAEGVTPEAAAALVPDRSLTTNLTGGLNYDSSDNAEFPTRGVRAGLSATYSFGRSGETPLGWTDVQSGASTYYGFGRIMEKSGGATSRQQVFAVRANAGTTFGNYPEGTGYSVGGGSSPVAARQIRGLADGELFGTNYFTTSAEYRYDFGLNAGIAQGLYGVVFADAGSAWGTTNNPNFDLKYGIGAGVQLDLGFGGARLPSLRFDYGFSPQNGSGKFYFRLGNFW
ncbi:outer membrane protein [Deinococcus malanensis]|uniref:Outer membrane protein n=2 Tax=Deinococcus malanensis TaxID=1706855 RepID=A0ABQ2EI92_9DEIO|nr:outer membrane protein assembly factor [Deinococcus malanensis]GGK13342.1 outer membrane protein [Deinococcus malanensis]